MNIVILSKGENLYSTKSLIMAGQARNHHMEVFDIQDCTQVIDGGIPSLLYRGEPMNEIDAVIPRIGASNTYFGSALVRQFHAMGVFCVVKPESILQSRNKWTSFQVLAQARIPVPNTALGNTGDIEALLEQFGDPPYIIKLLQGTHGQGVILAETYASALSTIETLQTARALFVVQEYIEESDGADIRVIVVDGKVIAAMKRQSRSDDFRSNLHRGGSSEVITLDYQQENVALRAARALKLGVCGVDILQSDRGPLVLEVNSTPGLEGIETTTGISVSSKIISYIERNKR